MRKFIQAAVYILLLSLVLSGCGKHCVKGRVKQRCIVIS